MSSRDREPKVAWWEYPWYVIVTLLLLLIGLWYLAGSMLTRTKIFTVVGLLLVAIVTMWAAYGYFHKVDLGDRTVTIIIEEGASFQSIADELVSAGVVDNRLILKYAARVTGVDRKLTPGRYDFVQRNSCRSVLRRLREADIYRIKVTIPEGAPIWKVASILADALDIDSVHVMELAEDSAFLHELDLPCLEGYLFPETYFFPWGTRAKDAIAEMVTMYYRKTEDIWPDEIPLGLTRPEIITLASIIEAETSVDSERVIVASVYTNRLRRDMKLDADPTVIYGLGGLNRPLYIRDLKKDTPYNTYLRKGLPPTPINSPGLAAIRAALNPATTDYLFFVADNSGGHRFSRTYAEHNRARREIEANR